jgi:hypothetical protein
MVNPIVTEFLEEEKNFYINCASVFRKFDGIGSKFSIISKKNPKPEVSYDPCRYIRGGEIIKSKPYDDEITNKHRSRTTLDGQNNLNGTGRLSNQFNDGINRMTMHQFNNNEFNNNTHIDYNCQASLPLNNQNPLNFSVQPNNNIPENNPSVNQNYFNQPQNQSQNQNMNQMTDFYNFNNNFSNNGNNNSFNNGTFSVNSNFSFNNNANTNHRNSKDINQNYTDINYDCNNFNNTNLGGNSFSNTNNSSNSNTHSSPSNPPNIKSPDDVFKDLF